MFGSKYWLKSYQWFAWIISIQSMSLNLCKMSKYYYAWIIIIQFMSRSYLEKCQNTISIIYVQCKLYVNLLTNILYVYMKHVYFITRMEWAPLAVNIFLKQNIYGWGWWNLNFFYFEIHNNKRVDQQCRMRYLNIISNKGYTFIVYEWGVYIKIRKHVVKLSSIHTYFV